MIRRITVSNYRSIGRDVQVPLGRFTALVGPNGSGKSSVVDVLGFVRDAMQMGLSGAITDRGGITAVRRWSSGRPFNVGILLEAEIEGGRAHYGFEITGDRQEEFRIKMEMGGIQAPGTKARFRIEEGRWQGPSGLRPKVNDTTLALPAIGGDERFKPLFDLLSKITIYSIFPDTLRTPQKYGPEKPMQRHGDNWVSILKDQPEKTWKPDLVDALAKLTGDISDIKVSKAAGYLVAQFRHGANSRGKWFDAGQESDGTLRVAGILTALLQEPSLPLIGVEEPELTVHPGVLPLLLDFLKEASHRSQVVITTHSPELLDLVSVDDVRIVERNEDGTRVTRMLDSQHEAVTKGLLGLGELMVTEGLQPGLPFEEEMAS